MSKERARCRAEREAVLAAQRVDRAREVAHRARRRAAIAALRRPVRWVARLLSPSKRSRPGSVLRRQRARQNGALLAVLAALNGVLWLAAPSWLLRGSVLALSALSWPLLVVMVFDRRRSV